MVRIIVKADGLIRSQSIRAEHGVLMLIRSERSDDRDTIADVVYRAYAAVVWSDHREHLMVDRLRQTEAFLPALSLVAEVDGEAIGHVLLTRARIGAGASAAETLALAPLSVVPERQNSGVGRELIREAHRRASALGFRSVLCVGNPSYYSRFGYRPLSEYPIRLPFEAPIENQMILPLAPGALDGVEGVARYAKGWLDH
jgi:predicted N-acetyltransferase YhbS